MKFKVAIKYKLHKLHIIIYIYFNMQLILNMFFLDFINCALNLNNNRIT